MPHQIHNSLGHHTPQTLLQHVAHPFLKRSSSALYQTSHSNTAGLQVYALSSLFHSASSVALEGSHDGFHISLACYTLSCTDCSGYEYAGGMMSYY
jgi:hypothetical protein